MRNKTNEEIEKERQEAVKEVLSNADIAYFCKGWDNYRGCRMEHKACKSYNIECLYDIITLTRTISDLETHKAQVALLKAYVQAEKAGEFTLDLSKTGYDKDLLKLIERLNYR